MRDTKDNNLVGDADLKIKIKSTNITYSNA